MKTGNVFFLTSVIVFVLSVYLLLYLRYSIIAEPIIPRYFVTRDTVADPNIQLIILIAGSVGGAVGWATYLLSSKLMRNNSNKELRYLHATIWVGFVLVLPLIFLLGLLTWLRWPPQYVNHTLLGYNVALVEKNEWEEMTLSVVVTRLEDQFVANEGLMSSQDFPLCKTMDVKQEGALYTFSCYLAVDNAQGFSKTVRVNKTSLRISSALTSRIISTSLEQLDYRPFR